MKQYYLYPDGKNCIHNVFEKWVLFHYVKIIFKNSIVDFSYTQIQPLILGFLDFTMLWKWQAVSRNRTSGFEFLPFLGLRAATWYSSLILGDCEPFSFQSAMRSWGWTTTYNHPVFIQPGKFHGQGSRASYSPWGPKESDMTERLSTHSW